MGSSLEGPGLKGPLRLRRNCWSDCGGDSSLPGLLRVKEKYGSHDLRPWW